jgi:predicted RNA-binding Zn-ribbon protein involved in translation (DUF1610 family)
LDIETSPCLADVWSLWNQNVSLSQLRQSAEVMCFAAKWLGDPKRETVFWSQLDGKRTMIGAAHVLLDEADAVCHWNGKRFDTPHLNREFLEGGLKPPAPFRQIDLCEVVKKQFRFPSNKLDYVAQQLGVGGKVQHEGHSLWVKCMAGDPAAWKRMERYNRQDVWLLEGLYNKLQPWIPGHPSHAAFEGGFMCPRCGSDRLQRRGTAFTLQSAYWRYQCLNCGGWSRDTKRTDGVNIREVANG